MVRWIKKKYQSASVASESAITSLVLTDVRVPEVLSGTEIGEITLSFRPEISYVKVRFKFFNEDIRISCKNRIGAGCTFEFHFDPDSDNHMRHFEIRLRRIRESCLEPIEILCLDNKGRHYEQAEQRWILLKTTPKPPAGNVIVDLFLYFWDVIKRWYIRYPLLAMCMITGMFYLNLVPQGATDRIKRKKEHIEISLGLMEPYHYIGVWQEDFSNVNGNRPSPANWDNAPSTWSVDKNSLLISGPEVGLIKLPDYYDFHNFEVNFSIFVEDPSGSAGWVLHASSKNNYYLFEITFPQNKKGLGIEGFTYEDGKQMQSFSNIPENIPAHPFDRGDILDVTIVVKENEFHCVQFEHTFNITRLCNTDNNPKNDIIDRPPLSSNTWTHVDPRNVHRFGRFGFKGNEKGGVIRVISQPPFRIRGVD